MKKLYALLLGVILFSVAARSQYVNIPDTSFRRYLNDKHPACFNGAGQLDTLCAAAATVTSFSFGYPDIVTYHMTNLDGIQYFKGIKSFAIYYPQVSISVIPKFPPNLVDIDIEGNHSLHTIPAIPDSVVRIIMGYNAVTSLPPLPSKLFSLECSENQLTNLPPLPSGLRYLDCVDNQLTRLPQLPSALYTLSCSNNKLDSLPPLPSALINLDFSSNKIKSLPALPDSLESLRCRSNMLLTSLPQLPAKLTTLVIDSTKITCLPVLPATLSTLHLDTSVTRCIPNTNNSLVVSQAWGSGSGQNSIIYNPRLCNVTNNANGCIVFPFVSGRLFYDLNNNNLKDPGEPYNAYAKILLSNGAYTFSNNNGYYEAGTSALGSFSLSPVNNNPLFSVFPSSKNFSFSRYDTVATQDFAYHATTIKDSVNISITPLYYWAMPGEFFSYDIVYKNAGSTNLNATSVKVMYDSSKLTFYTPYSSAFTNAGNTLILNLPSLLFGASDWLHAWFKVKTTAVLGDVIKSFATITSGTITCSDSANGIVVTSHDPNDKDATPVLTPQQISTGKFIDYVIRFQNTGNAAATHVVIADTLSSQLQANTLEMVSTSHLCKATVKGNTVSFEMRNIMLPDSNTNEARSHGFIRFRVKPASNLVTGNHVDNKASIYFDYNRPVVTNTAATQIVSQTFPLKLIYFRGYRQPKGNVLLQWQTANEMNTRSFDIEQSDNGRSFVKMYEIPSAGDGSHNYTYTTDKAIEGNVYFRLKIKDKDGVYTYSPVILIKTGDIKHGFVLGENPVRDKLLITTVNPSLINTEATLVNSLGIVVKRFTITSGAQSIATGTLPAGIYYLQTQAGSEKVMVEK